MERNSFELRVCHVGHASVLGDRFLKVCNLIKGLVCLREIKFLEIHGKMSFNKIMTKRQRIYGGHGKMGFNKRMTKRQRI